MITQWQNGETIVGRLRIEGARVDPAIAQLRLSTLLNGALSHPAALPPSAIVFIRKLCDPLPRSIRIQPHDIRPPAIWQQALNAKLETLVTKAARPALGAVPSNAEAVVFLDRSELLASLASDWSEGQITTRWWWQNLLKKASASQLVKEFWSSAPEYVPAALNRLAQAAQAVRFVETFTDSEVCRLLIEVARTFSLDDLARVVDRVLVQKFSNFSDEHITLQPSSVESVRNVRATLRVTKIAPWSSAVRESETASLQPEQQRFLGVALMLARTPARVRGTSFAREVEAWSNEPIVTLGSSLDLPESDDRKSETKIPSVSSERIARIDPSSTLQLVGEAPSPEEPSHTSVSPSRDDTVSTGTIPAASISHDPVSSRLDETPTIPQQSATRSQRHPALSPPEHTHTPSLVKSEPVNSQSPVIATEPPAVALDESSPIELQISTDFGGVFYLINLGIYLGLYGDFTTPAEPGIELNIWDFVSLVGHELVGERLTTDPVWNLLERLSGRTEAEKPGSTFELKTDADQSVQAWLDRLMPGVRNRLQQALGLSETEDPGRLLCEHHARVCVTPTHVDVFMSLNELPIEIRFSGLDRDCGWVPAAGRFINFHFE
ncbi:MAG TPA: hypothetical protein VFI24_27310 [Pyrinomonadaceae bacterium]|nr:hypothetical protein [Pyrinomonadaceae bacterium]